jgi:hypothetical protein
MQAWLLFKMAKFCEDVLHDHNDDDDDDDVTMLERRS